MFENAITSLDWLWEPEITAEIDSQVQAIVKGATEPRSAGAAIEAVAQDLRSSGRSYYSTEPDGHRGFGQRQRQSGMHACEGAVADAVASNRSAGVR